MLVGSSLTSLGLSLGGIVLAGPDLGPAMMEGLMAAFVLSAFATICALEGWLAG